MSNSVLDSAKTKRRIFDQTATMHFRLSDKYKFWANVEDILEIVTSVFLCGITFLDHQRYFSIDPDTSTLMLGGASIFLFAFTLVKQRLDHKQLWEKHNLAGKLYAQAKITLSSRITEWETMNIEDEVVLNYIESQFSSLNDLPQIPEKDFLRLKHAHQEKVAFSKFLDDHPNDFWFLCKIKFRFSH